MQRALLAVGRTTRYCPQADPPIILWAPPQLKLGVSTHLHACAAVITHPACWAAAPAHHGIAHPHKVAVPLAGAVAAGRRPRRDGRLRIVPPAPVASCAPTAFCHHLGVRWCNGAGPYTLEFLGPAAAAHVIFVAPAAAAAGSKCAAAAAAATTAAGALLS